MRIAFRLLIGIVGVIVVGVVAATCPGQKPGRRSRLKMIFVER